VLEGQSQLTIPSSTPSTKKSGVHTRSEMSRRSRNSDGGRTVSYALRTALARHRYYNCSLGVDAHLGSRGGENAFVKIAKRRFFLSVDHSRRAKEFFLPAFTRRSFLKTGGLTAGAGLTLIGGDALLWEPNRPRLVKVELKFDRLPREWDGLRIVQLSDFHYDTHFSVVPLRKSIEIVNPLQPDLVLLTGDFVTNPPFHRRKRNHPTALDAAPCSAILQQIKSKFGSYAVMGNHDATADPDHISEILEAHEIRVLRNLALPLEQKGSRIWLAGIDDILEGDPDLVATLEKIPRDEFSILMAHEPDFAVHVARESVDFQLSGHSHGGQVRFPFIGAPILPNLGRDYPMGLYQLGKLTLYTNVGLGTIGLPIRWNCPPEITLFTLRRTEAGT
jgi:predicted MPP superfamily phosphohydrolase